MKSGRRIPSTIERGVGKSIFGVDAQGYAQARPAYPARIGAILRANCGAVPGSRVFEVGAGAGEATAMLLDMGCQVTAVEPDRRLAAVLWERLGRHGECLCVRESSFEEVGLAAASFDIGTAAMALHWLDPHAALTKAFRLLRPGGYWAMWWTVFGDPGEMDAFQRRTEHLFAPLARSPSQGTAGGKPFALDRAARMTELAAAGFRSLSYEEIRWQPTLDTQQVLALTASFSPVARLAEAERRRFLGQLAKIADEEFQGRVTRNFVTAIYTAQRPGP